MKYLLISLACVLLVFVISCSENEISSDKLQERNGIYYAVNETKPYSGKVIDLHDNGQKRYENEYEDGLLDGLSTRWNSNGQKQYENEYAEGKLNGLSIEWYSNGQNKAEISYKAGLQSGNFKTWYENGQQATDGSYKDNKKDGKWTYWYDSGKKKKEISFNYGKKECGMLLWDKNEKIIDIVEDIDCNAYRTIKIGSQVWMAENLRVTHYHNGEAIPNVTDNSRWSNLNTGAYCSYNNNARNIDNYGLLYNWYAVDDSRGLAPEGWHIPTDKEWTALEKYLGSNAGGKLKAMGTNYWKNPNEGATNSSGFSALPGGYRYYYNGSFDYVGHGGYWWSSPESGSSGGWYRFLDPKHSGIYLDHSKQYGFSVRCIKD